MLSYFDLRKGIQFILDDQPHEVLEFCQMGKAQDVFVAQTKIKNLATGKIYEKNFHHGDEFKEAEVSKIKIKFLYSHRNKFLFCEKNNTSKRFSLEEEQIGDNAKFLKPNEIIEGIVFNEKIINISLPIKIKLKVIQAPPGFKGDSAQSRTKIVTLETKAEINAPLFIEEGDIIEINTERGEYVRRIEKGKS